MWPRRLRLEVMWCSLSAKMGETRNLFSPRAFEEIIARPVLWFWTSYTAFVLPVPTRERMNGCCLKPPSLCYSSSWKQICRAETTLWTFLLGVAVWSAFYLTWGCNQGFSKLQTFDFHLYLNMFMFSFSIGYNSLAKDL